MPVKTLSWPLIVQKLQLAWKTAGLPASLVLLYTAAFLILIWLSARKTGSGSRFSAMVLTAALFPPFFVLGYYGYHPALGLVGVLVGILGYQAVAEPQKLFAPAPNPVLAGRKRKKAVPPLPPPRKQETPRPAPVLPQVPVHSDFSAYKVEHGGAWEEEVEAAFELEEPEPEKSPEIFPGLTEPDEGGASPEEFKTAEWLEPTLYEEPLMEEAAEEEGPTDLPDWLEVESPEPPPLTEEDWPVQTDPAPIPPVAPVVPSAPVSPHIPPAPAPHSKLKRRTLGGPRLTPEEAGDDPERTED